jgi:two-component system NtrC family sensor kinase
MEESQSGRSVGPIPMPLFQQRRLSVQSKVLIPVITCLALLPAVTVAIVNGRTSRQIHAQAVSSLATADGVFRQVLENDQRSLLARFQNALSELQYRGIAGLAARSRNAAAFDPIREFLRERLKDYNDDTAVMLFTYDEGTPAVGAAREAPFEPAEFARAAAGLTRSAFRGDAATGCLSLDGVALEAAALPVTNLSGEPVGVLTVGRRIGDATVQELKKLTAAEILVLADGKVAASTLPPAEAAPLAAAYGAARTGAGAPAPDPRVIQGEHFLGLGGAFGGEGGGGGFRYALLSSYEHSLLALEETRRTLVGISLAGILLSAALVWYCVRRLTHPLSELRAGAEAVGRGDFSRRVRPPANDECGDLAEAFNQMTANLQTSRTELEKAVEILRATQTQLIQSEKLAAVGQFVAGVAHELNNPLTAVIGFSDLLVHTTDDVAIRPHLDRIAKSAQRCHKIVQNLLSFARQHPPEREPLAVNGAIDDVLELMAYDLRTSNIQVVRGLEEGLPMILADRHQLQQVFSHVISNARQAVQAVRTDGKLTVRTRRAGDRVRIEFTDNGPGIRPEHLPRIFDPFFTTKPVGKGVGLGLSLSYGIVLEHGGAITAASELGQGATFAIELPVAPPAAGAQSGEAAAAPEPGPGRGQRVLVVDDEEWILDLTAELLRRDGYEVQTVPSAEKAVAALGAGKFDVIACDWKMPGMSGIQFYEHLLATAPAAATRVFFMTGDVVNESLQEFLRRHGRACVTKPFSIKEFKRAVASFNQ